MKFRLYIILLLLLSCSHRLCANDEYKFRSYMTSSGLSDNSVLCGIRDRYGFMWFGTANGLCCYDGKVSVSYRNFATVDGKGVYGSDIVASLMEYGDDIYVGCSNGIMVFRRAKGVFEPFGVATRYGVVISSTVQRMYRARNGYVWIGTRGQGLFIYNPRTGNMVQNSRAGGFVCDIAQTVDGNVSVAMLDGRVNVFSQYGRFLTTYKITGYVSDKTHICVQSEGNALWIGTDVGLYYVDETRGNISNYRPPFFVGAISSLAKRSDGTLLVGTKRGLYSFDTDTHVFSRIDDDGGVKGLSDEDVTGVMVDRDGTLWVFTSQGGVNYLPRNEVMFRFNALPGNKTNGRSIVSAFAPAGDGDMWVGTNSGLYRYSKATGAVTPYGGALSKIAVRTLYCDGRLLWIGTAMNGLKVLDTSSGEIRSYEYSETTPYSLPSNQVNDVYRGYHGTLFVATSWGLCRFDSSTKHFFTFTQLPSAVEFVDVCGDALGNVWAATNGSGLYCMSHNTGQWKRYAYEPSKPYSLPVNTITAVKSDSYGRLWVATRGGGLCLYDSSIDGFVRCEGVGDIINFMCEDSQRTLWVGTDRTLFMVGRGTRPAALRVFSPPEMWSGLLMQRSANYSSSDMMFIGNTEGFYTFSPLQIRNDAQAPVYISAISFPNASDPSAETAKLGLDGAMYVNKRVELPYRDNSFTLHFSSPRFSSSQSVLYDYMLKGVDKQWAHSTSNIETTYANVPPGEYEFLLKETGSDAAPARLYIKVLAPWYLTWIAMFFYAVALIVGGYLVWRLVQSVARRRYDSKLEQYRADEAKRMFESKISFFVNLVHEIRTPLSLIVLPLEQLAKRKHDESDRKCISVMSKNVNYLLSMANQLLDFQKAESGKFEVHRADMSVSSYLREIYEQFSPYCEVEHKIMRMEMPDDDIVTAVDRDIVGKILMNLMSNALKYTRTGIVLRLAMGGGDKVCVSVIDDGPGVADSEKKRIFDSFYQISIDRVAQSMGTGIGLAFAKALAVAHGGDIRVDDAPGGGACFTLELPLTLVGRTDSGKRQQPVMIDVGSGSDAGPGLKSFTVLLVEDNRQLLDMMGEALGSWYRVLCAKNGAEALDLMAGNDVDVVVSDVMMPVMDGITLCSKIKGDINFSHIPVILLTAKISVEAKVAGMKSGADVYLEKPFAIEQLYMQIENLFRLRQNFHKRMGAAEGNMDVTAASELGVNQQDMTFLQKVQDVFEDNVADETFSIDMLASALNMSRSSFYRKLKALTGMTPVDFMRAQRIRRGASLLLTGRSVSEVAAMVGFSSPSYFTKCFKMELGVLPKDYVDSRSGANLP